MEVTPKKSQLVCVLVRKLNRHDTYFIVILSLFFMAKYRHIIKSPLLCVHFLHKTLTLVISVQTIGLFLKPYWFLK